MNYLDTKVL